MLDYENCQCKKKIVDKLDEERTENIDKLKIAGMVLFQPESRLRCSSYTLYIALFSILFTINAEIGVHFVYSRWYSKKDVTRVKFGTRTQAITLLLN